MIKIYRYGEVSNDEIFARPDLQTGVESIVAGIIANVRQQGDSALFDYAKQFDKAELSSLEVTEAEIDEAFALVGEEFAGILQRSAANIRKFRVPDAYHGKGVRFAGEQIVLKEGKKVGS